MGNPIGEEEQGYANLIQLSYDYGDTPSLQGRSGAYHHNLEEKRREFHHHNPNYTLDKHLSDANSVVATRKDGAVVMATRGTMLKPRDLVADARVIKDYRYDGKVFEENMKKYERVREKYAGKKHIITGHSLGSQSAKQISQKYGLESHLFSMFDVGTGANYGEEPAGERTYYTGHSYGLYDPLAASSRRYKGKHVSVKANSWNSHSIGNFTRSLQHTREHKRQLHIPHGLDRHHSSACMIRNGRRICF